MDEKKKGEKELKKVSMSVDKPVDKNKEKVAYKIKDVNVKLFTFTQPKASLPVIAFKPIQINNKYIQVLI